VRWLLCLDNDGVLVDTEDVFFAATRQALAEVGIALDRAGFIEAWMRSGQGLRLVTEAQGLDETALEALRTRRDAIYDDLLAGGARVFDGVREGLERLASQVRLCIVTSCQPRHFALIHRHSGLLTHIERCVTSDDFSRYKPDPDPYQTALRLAGVPAGRALAAEDTPHGVRAASGAGIACAALPTDLTSGLEFPGAAARLRSFAELVEWVEQTIET